MSFPSYIMEKGIKSLETDTELNFSKEDHLNKLNLVTEELLYLKLLRQHKNGMFFIFFLHLSIILLLIFRIMNKAMVEQDSYFCQHAFSFRNIIYIALNLPFLAFSLQSLNREKAILSNISYYERASSLLVLVGMSSVIIFLFKFVPDYICQSVTIGMQNSLYMSTHILVESFLLYFYFLWFQKELKNFGSLINQFNFNYLFQTFPLQQMKIKELIIDGFKSYATKTVLRNFDTQFNALTGENGTGKSNVLEAIFFVLGLSMKSAKLARVQNPRDLIYNKGQSDVKKARVTLIFCNKDKNKCPVGYESFDELILQRTIHSYDNKTKFRLNGKVKTNSQVKGMFKSIKLNIDNYSTFFVQQGKVAEIVKFKPLNLMSFIEETAGVSYFNQVKNDTEKSIKKTDPQLKCNFQQFDNLEKENKILKNNFENFKEYQLLQKKLDELHVKLENLHRQQGFLNKIKLQQQQKEIKESIQNLEQQNKQCTAVINQNILSVSKLQQNNQFEELNEQIKQMKNLQEEEYKFQVQEKIYSNDYQQMKMKQQQMVLKLNEEKIRKVKNKQILIFNEKNLEMKILEQKKIEIKLKEYEFQKGKNINDQLKNQLREKEQDNNILLQKQSNQQDLIKQEKLILSDSKQSILELQVKSQKIQKQLNFFLEKENEQKDSLNSLQNKIKNKMNDKENCNRLNQQLNSLKSEKRNIIGWMTNHFEINNLPQIQQKFGKNKVYGKVYQLMQVNNTKYLTALNKIIGFKLFYIIVSDENISEKLMQSNLIQGDINIIPNNKIKSRTPGIQQITEAKQIANRMNGQVYTPFELIQFPEELRRSFEFIFSNYFICSSQEIARELFKRKFNTITVDGDKYSAGQIEGGYQDDKKSFLKKAIKIKMINQKIEKIQFKLKTFEDDYKYQVQQKQQIYQLKQLQEKIKYNQDQLSNLQINEMNQRIAQLEMSIQNNMDQLQDYKQRIDENNKLIINYKKQKNGNKSNQQKFLQTQHNNLLKQKDLLYEEIKTIKVRIRRLELELANNDDEKIIEKDSQEIENNFQNQKIKIENIKKQIQDLQEQINDEQTKKNQILNQIRDFVQNRKQQEQQKEQNFEQLKQLKQQLTGIREILLELNNVIRNDECIEIEENQNLIMDIENLKQEQERKKLKLNSLRKNITQDAEDKFLNFQNKFENLQNQKVTLISNKKTLEDSIKSLDIKKFESILMCFEKVNTNLKQIFSNMLPGAHAEMIMKDVVKQNQTFKGIEIKIKFGNKWKSGLGELSGGQRTLLAISFLLALLKYNSAPFYIFDEIDAALDLSHTENLGKILSQYFSESQFFIISLKEGFYRNSNVLFRTSNINGKSKIQRINMKNKQLIIQYQISFFLFDKDYLYSFCIEFLCINFLIILNVFEI